MQELKQEIVLLLKEYQEPKRKPFSKYFPFLKRFFVISRRLVRKINNFSSKIARDRASDTYINVVSRHQSLLMRKLGVTDIQLQKNKIVNLKQAIKKLDKLKIKPGETFSFWEIVGEPSYKNGFIDGMLLSGGNVLNGVGGGLCQLSNLLFWLFLHTPLEIVGRHHHSLDVFPDSGRVLPFGSGATILFNYLDLKVKNNTNYTFQLKLWITDAHLKGQITSSNRVDKKYHLFEKNHYFVKSDEVYYRYNQIYRQTLTDNKVIKEEKIITNFAPVLYKINPTYLYDRNYSLINFDE